MVRWILLALALPLAACDDRGGAPNPLEASAQQMEQGTDEWAAGMRDDQRTLLGRAARGDLDAAVQARTIDDHVEAAIGGTMDRAASARAAGERIK